MDKDTHEPPIRWIPGPYHQVQGHLQPLAPMQYLEVTAKKNS